MKECIDEGTLQAYFDGQLAPEIAAAVASHLAACRNCAEVARTVENENLLLAGALENEFAVSVPTERLRQRLETAISEDQIAQPVSGQPSKSGWWQSLANLLFPSPQRAFGYAGLAAVIVLSAVFGVIYLKRGDVTTPVAQNQPGQPISAPSPSPTPAPPTGGSGNSEDPPPPKPNPPKKVAPRRPSIENAGLIPGERPYVQKIAALKKTLKSNEPLRPSVQVEYEHNVALLDSAIEITRDAVKKNPKDTQATQFMFAAYQSKVALMNQVADARPFNTQK